MARNNKEIISYNMQTKEIKYYKHQCDAILDGFDTCKIGESCRKPNLSHRGHIWFYKQDYCPVIVEYRFKLITRPHHSYKNSLKIINVKKCNKCQLIKDRNQFRKNYISKYGIRSECINCHNKIICKRKKENILFKLIYTIRHRTNIALKVKKFIKTKGFNEYLGCTPDELKNHLEAQFEKGMSWDNHGKWHIDHKNALSKATTIEELYERCHYINLQPLWAEDNWSKGAK